MGYVFDWCLMSLHFLQLSYYFFSHHPRRWVGRSEVNTYPLSWSCFSVIGPVGRMLAPEKGRDSRPRKPACGYHLCYVFYSFVSVFMGMYGIHTHYILVDCLFLRSSPEKELREYALHLGGWLNVQIRIETELLPNWMLSSVWPKSLSWLPLVIGCPLIQPLLLRGPHAHLSFLSKRSKNLAAIARRFVIPVVSAVRCRNAKMAWCHTACFSKNSWPLLNPLKTRRKVPA